MSDRDHAIEVYAGYSAIMLRMAANLDFLKMTVAAMHDRNDRLFLELQIRVIENDLSDLVDNMATTISSM